MAKKSKKDEELKLEAKEVKDDVLTSDIIIEPASVPEMGSVQFNDYVMSLLTNNEKENGNPKTDGLRRVAFNLLGRFNTLIDIVQTPNSDNAYRATVAVKLEFMDRVVCGSADVYAGNTEAKFAKHAVATAETRAEGRALRRALLLNKLVAEELNDADPDEPNGLSENKPAPSGIIATTKIAVERQKINLENLLTFMKIDLKDKKSYSDMTMAQSKQICQMAANIARGDVEVPEGVKL